MSVDGRFALAFIRAPIAKNHEQYAYTAHAPIAARICAIAIVVSVTLSDDSD